MSSRPSSSVLARCASASRARRYRSHSSMACARPARTTTPRRAATPSRAQSSSSQILRYAKKGSYPFFDSMRRKRGTTPFSLTRYALVIVLRAEAFEQLDCIGERLDPLHRAVRHVGRRLSNTVDERHIGAFRDQIRNHLVVAARGGVVQRRVAVGVARVDVGVQLLDEILHRGEHAGRRKAVRIGGEALAVAGARGGEQRRGGGARRGKRLRRRGIL